MPKPKPRDIPDVRVDDADAAFRKLEGFTRKVMAVPKSEIDHKLSTERSSPRRRKD
jgi:hypothetical protein